MKRRSAEISGWVNFPVHDPTWTNTFSGGMVVKLVVCDNRSDVGKFGLCIGASVTDTLVGGLVGDDRRPLPANKASRKGKAQSGFEEQQALELYHYPLLHHPDESEEVRNRSRDYLAVIVIGSTGWSGLHTADSYDWKCRREDLTVEGRTFYAHVQAQYPGCELHLLTFLDAE
jgi:hypothetical protein